MIFLINQLLSSLIFFLFFSFCFLFHWLLIMTILFIRLSLGLVGSYFSDYWRWRLKAPVWDFSSETDISNEKCLSAALAASHTFSDVVFHFHPLQNIFYSSWCFLLGPLGNCDAHCLISKCWEMLQIFFRFSISSLPPWWSDNKRLYARLKGHGRDCDKALLPFSYWV